MNAIPFVLVCITSTGNGNGRRARMTRHRSPGSAARDHLESRNVATFALRYSWISQLHWSCSNWRMEVASTLKFMAMLLLALNDGAAGWHSPVHSCRWSTCLASGTFLQVPFRGAGISMALQNGAASGKEVALPGANCIVAPGSREAILQTKELLFKADAVFFDVDSTVLQTEGIDLLGQHFGVMKEIAELTMKAMGGNVRFEEALAARLQILADHGMTRHSLESYVKHEGQLDWSPGVQHVVHLLRKQGVDVYLLSGGFQNMIAPVALELRIPLDNVYANEILFDEDGYYAGFNRSRPTSRSGGKPDVLEMLKARHGYKTMIMIGDGATDMDTRTQGLASAFIGYGGVVVRDKVKSGADWFIYSFQEILDVLQSDA